MLKILVELSFLIQNIYLSFIYINFWVFYEGFTEPHLVCIFCFGIYLQQLNYGNTPLKEESKKSATWHQVVQGGLMWRQVVSLWRYIFCDLMWLNVRLVEKIIVSHWTKLHHLSPSCVLLTSGVSLQYISFTFINFFDLRLV